MTFAAIRHALLVLADECDGGREYAEISELLSAWEVRCAMGKKFTIVRRKHHGSSLNEFLEGERVLEEFEAVARAETIEAMREADEMLRALQGDWRDQFIQIGRRQALAEIKSLIIDMENE